MRIRIRPARQADIPDCGRILFTAFKNVADRHGFPPDFSSPEAALGVARVLVASRRFYGVVAEAESDGHILGSNFLSERDPIRSVGLLSVDPQAHGQGIGRQLMEAVLARASAAPSVRLVQDAFNAVSLALYASLGFDVKEPLALVAGKPKTPPPRGVDVRPLRHRDLEACSALCERVHGFPRASEMRDAVDHFSPMVAIRHGRICAYATTLTQWQVAHAVAETEEDLQGLILAAGATTAEPLSFLVPTRRATFFRWCLREGFRIVKPMTLMALGAYREPKGAFLPSVAY